MTQENRADMRYIKPIHGRLTPPVYPPTPPTPPDLIGMLRAQLDLNTAALNSLAAAIQGLGGGGGGSTPVLSTRAKNLQTAVLPLGAANKEVSYQFSIGTKNFVIHARNGNEVRMSTQQGIVTVDPAVESRDPRFTLKANTAYSQDDLNITDFTQTFYFACSVANEVLEIIIGV